MLVSDISNIYIGSVLLCLHNRKKEKEREKDREKTCKRQAVHLCDLSSTCYSIDISHIKIERENTLRLINWKPFFSKNKIDLSKLDVITWKVLSYYKKKRIKDIFLRNISRFKKMYQMEFWCRNSCISSRILEW